MLDFSRKIMWFGVKIFFPSAIFLLLGMASTHKAMHIAFAGIGTFGLSLSLVSVFVYILLSGFNAIDKYTRA